MTATPANKNVQILNVQVNPGLVDFPPSQHPGIGPGDPSSWGQLTPGTVPGHPTAVLLWCEGTATAGVYPSMLWSPQKLIATPPNCTHLNFDCDVTIPAAYVKGGNCLEIDTMIALNKRVFPAGFHIILAQGGKAEVCDSTGRKWLDAGFDIVLTPDTQHHFTFQTQYDWNANTMTWLGIVVDGKTYKVTPANAVVQSGTTWGWNDDGFKQQFQMDNLTAAPLIAVQFDNCNNTFMP